MLIYMFNSFITQVLLLNRIGREAFNPLNYKMTWLVLIGLFLIYLIQAIDLSVQARGIAIMTWVLLDLFIIFWLQFVVSVVADMSGALHVDLLTPSVKVGAILPDSQGIDNSVRMKTQAEEEPDWWAQ